MVLVAYETGIEFCWFLATEEYFDQCIDDCEYFISDLLGISLTTILDWITLEGLLVAGVNLCVSTTGEEEDRLGVRWGKCWVDGFDFPEGV